MSAPPTAVIFDLDGVIRDWNDTEVGRVEQAHGLEPGTILAVGFSKDLGPQVTTGRISDTDWMAEIHRRVLAEHGPSAQGALDWWEANVGHVDTDMLAVLRAVRSHCPVAVLSNGTTRLRSDLAALGLTDEFDEIVNTAEIGVAKPHPDAYRIALERLGAEPTRALFIDDLAPNVEGARAVGITAHHHTGRDGTVEFLRAQGLRV